MTEFSLTSTITWLRQGQATAFSGENLVILINIYFTISTSNKVCNLMKQIINRVRLHASGQAARNAKAAAVKEAAGELLALWEKDVSKFRGANFYMHIAYHHLPDFISRLPVDILQASGDSFEAKNQELKRRLRR